MLWCKGIQVRAALIPVAFVTELLLALSGQSASLSPLRPALSLLTSSCIPRDSGISAWHITAIWQRKCVYKLSSFALIDFSSDPTIHEMDKVMTAPSVCRRVSLSAPSVFEFFSSVSLYFKKKTLFDGHSFPNIRIWSFYLSFMITDEEQLGGQKKQFKPSGSWIMWREKNMSY